MSVDYFINIELKNEFSIKTILKILDQGTKNGFTYYDYDNNSISSHDVTNVADLAQHIFNADQNAIDRGPRIYANIIGETNILLSFYRTDNSGLLFRISNFGIPRKKEYYLDIGYYLPFFLELCKDLTVTTITTETFW